MFLIVAICCVGVALGQFQQGVIQGQNPAVPILEDVRDGPYPDGAYYFRYATADGIFREEQAVPTGPDTFVVTGSYSYTAPNGQVIDMQYIADENGYRAFPRRRDSNQDVGSTSFPTQRPGQASLPPSSGTVQGPQPVRPTTTPARPAPPRQTTSPFQGQASVLVNPQTPRPRVPAQQSYQPSFQQTRPSEHRRPSSQDAQRPFTGFSQPIRPQLMHQRPMQGIFQGSPQQHIQTIPGIQLLQSIPSQTTLPVSAVAPPSNFFGHRHQDAQGYTNGVSLGVSNPFQQGTLSTPEFHTNIIPVPGFQNYVQKYVAVPSNVHSILQPI